MYVHILIPIDIYCIENTNLTILSLSVEKHASNNIVVATLMLVELQQYQL